MRKEYLYLLLCIWAANSMCSSYEYKGAGDYEGDAVGECSDGIDNDRDGFLDCEDDGCAGASSCLSVKTDVTKTQSDTVGDDVNDSNDIPENTGTVEEVDTESVESDPTDKSSDTGRDDVGDLDEENTDTGTVDDVDTKSVESDSTDEPSESDTEIDNVDDSGGDNTDTGTVDDIDTGTVDDIDTGTVDDIDTGIVDDFNTENICEKIELTAGAVPNRVLIIQDLSSSLKNHGRWDQLKEAMVQVLDAFDNEIALGVVPFATTILDGGVRDADCTVNSEHVISPKPGNGDAIYDLVYTIETNDLIGGTPTYDALRAGREVLVNEDPNNGSTRHMILVTDGLPNCFDGHGMGIGEQEDIDRVTNYVQTIHDEDDIEIFVVGYSMDSNSMGNLDTWAELGGTQNAYPADDAVSLVEQMSSISVGLVTCSYNLDTTITDPRYVRVQIDGTTLPYGEADGWSLDDDKQTVTFEGASCDLLQNGERHDIDVAVECFIVII